MPRVGIISNPFSRITRLDPNFNTRLWYTVADKGIFEVARSHEDLNRICQEFANRDISHVGIFGGDGSICLTLSALAKAYPPDRLPQIMLLGGGTVNVLAGNMRIPNNPHKNLKRYVEILSRGGTLQSFKIHSLRINGHLGFLFGAGSAALFLREFYRNKGSRWSSFLFLLHAIADYLCFGKISGISKRLVSQEHTKVEITHKKTTKSTFHIPLSIGFAASIPRIPFRILLFRNQNSLLPEAHVFLSQLTDFRLPIAILKAFLRKTPTSKNDIFSKFSSLHLIMPNNTLYTVDGELFTTKDGIINIDMGPPFIFCAPCETIENVCKSLS